tara:strand:+ start:1331 stop:1648 length:318 start_codon:yes stop_codon:yes gene_type:complete
MANAKTHDLVVTKGSYEKNGETKKKYETIGNVWKREDGSIYVTISRLFNPAGLPNPKNTDILFADLYASKPYTGSQQQAPAQQAQQKPMGDFGKSDPFQEENPFS